MYMDEKKKAAPADLPAAQENAPPGPETSDPEASDTAEKKAAPAGRITLRLTRGDRRLLLLLGGGALLCMLVQTIILGHSPGSMVEITVGGKLVQTVSLSTDRTIQLTGVGGGTNTLVIKNGKADMTEADCPDQICVKHRAVSKKGESIVCLPHQIVVTVTGGEAAEVDAGTQ